MHKIPMLFEREGRFATPTPNPKAEWIFSANSFIAHRKYDGTCMKFDGEVWWFRRSFMKIDCDCPPEGFVEEEFDPNTGKAFGWVPVAGGDFAFAKYFNKAVELPPLHYDFTGMDEEYQGGTYELIGPKVNGNPEGMPEHRLVSHDNAEQLGEIQTFDLSELSPEQIYELLKNYLRNLTIEGIVFKSHDMAQMAKIRRKDFDYSGETEDGKTILKPFKR